MHKKILNVSIKILGIIVLFTLALRLQSCDDKNYILKYSGQDPNTAPCATQLDSLTLSVGSSINTYPVSASGSITNVGYYLVTCTFNAGNDYLTFLFLNKPTIDGSYQMSATVTSNGSSVYSYMNWNGYDGWPDKQYPIWIKIINGKINIYICAANFTDYNYDTFTINALHAVVN